MAIRSIDDYLDTLQSSFIPAAAGGQSLVLQYVFTGREQGMCFAAITAGDIRVARGIHPSPTLIVKTDFDLWLRVVTHDVDGLIAYQDGLYAVEGDIIHLMDFDLWFARS